MASTKSQTNSPACRQAGMNKIRSLKQNRFDHLDIGAWNLFGIWSLEFEI